MAKKKKQETGKTIWHIREDGSVVPIIQNQQEEIAPVKDTWLKKGALDDSGYAIQNPLDAINRFNASILMTGVDALGQFGKGFLSSAEGVTDIAKTTTADVLDFFGADNKARQLRKSAEDQWGINKELDESLIDDNGFGIDDMSFLGTKGKGVGQGLGTTAFSLTTGSLGGSAVSMGLLGLSAAGNAEQEAIKEMKANQKINGLSDKEIYQQAKLYGLISGTVEAGTEMMFGGLAQGSKLLGIGTGAFDSADDAVINALTKKISNKLVKTFTQAGLKATSEGVEEVLSGLGNAWAKKLTYMKQEDINKLIEDEDLLDSFLSGTFSAALSQSPSVARNITTTENGKLRLQTNEEIRDFITNLNQQEQQVVEREVENRLGQEEKVTKKRRAEIQKQVIEDLDRGYINANTIRDVLGENYNAERDVRLNESFNEEIRRGQAYENDLSKYDEKQRKTIQTAIDSGLLNNSNKTHDFVDLIAKLSADKGIDFDFTNNERIKESGFAIDGKQVNGFIKDGKIALNLESNQVLNKTVGHEITHVLEGTELYNSLQDSLKSFIGEREWNNRISELEKTYKDVKGANIENELTSDLVGEYVFNDESFVKSLSTKNPNLFQKIFDEIKYMVKIATAGSKEARDLEKVKRAFEKAYRETSKTQEGTQYSIKESKQMLEKQFKELTGDSLLRAEGKLGLYAFQQMNNIQAEAPYNEEAMKLFNAIQNSKKTSSHLYHSTPADRIQSIVQNGLQVGSEQNQEGVSSTDKLYLSATEELADSFTPNDSVTLRISPNANLENLDNDLLGGEGSYTITNNIDPKYLQVKENGKWVNLLKSQYAKQDVKYSLTTDNQGRQLSEQQQEFFKDSKVRDDEGNLKEVYHRTYRGGFNVFENKKGIHFFTDDADASYYGDNRYNVYLNITNPLVIDGEGKNYNQIEFAADGLDQYNSTSIKSVVDNIDIATKEDIINLAQAIDSNNSLRDYIDEFNTPKEMLDSVIEAYDEGATLEQFVKDYGGLSMFTENDNIPSTKVTNTQDITEYAKANGYDGVIFNNIQDKTNGAATVYATFESNQAKNIDNTNPTSNPDIRYSLSEDAETFKTPYGVEVVKNPSTDDYIQMRQDILEEYPWLRGEKILRQTYDEEGNVYYWNAYDAQHADVEPYINKKYNTRTFQNDGWWKNPIYKDSPKDYSYVDTSNFKYSLSDTDSQGKELTKEQQEYFKDSKVRDNEGRLLEVYHGSYEKGFTIFDKSMRGSATNAKSSKYGFFFTDNYNLAKDYSQRSATGQLFKSYLNMTNPLVKDFNGEQVNADAELTKMLKEAQSNGNDGIIAYNLKDGFRTDNQYVVFNSNQIKNVDNTIPTISPDIRYSLSVQEANTTQDNEGRKLTDNQLAYFKDSKAVDENGNLVTVYHTMTNTGNQFFEFNPVGTDFYRFGDQVVNYFTDNQDMSGSYADSNYKRAYTKPIKSMEDVQDFIKFQNTQNDSKIGVNGITSHYSIEKNGDGFTLKQTPSGKEFLGYDNLSEEGKVALNRLRANERVQKEFERSSNPIVVITDTLKGWDIVREYKGYPELAELVELYDREAQKLIATGTTYEEQMVIREILKNDLENYLFGTQEYSDEKVNEVIERSLTKQFENEQDLIDNIQNNFQAKYQYAGYINMTNPYVIDTFGENWDSVTTERNEAKNSEYNRVVKDNETKEKLYNLAQESERLFKEYSQSNKPREFAEYSIIKNKINNSELREVVNDMGMFGLTYEGWLEAGKKNAELFGEEFKQTLPNSDEKISNYTESLNPTEQELVQDLTIGEFVNRYGELYKENMKFGDSSSYFKDQFRTTTGTTLDTDKIGYSNMFDLARYNFDGSSVSEFLDEKLTTNDLVKRIIEKNNSGETNYDGLIMKNVYDYGGQSNKSYRTTGDLYVTFNSNQFKAVDNLNPTNDADIRYQLGNNEVAPTSGWNVRSEDVRLQSAFKDTIAPLQEQVQQLTDTITRLEDRIAPLNEQEADELYQETQRGFENEVAPIRENLTPEENQRMDMLELLERNNMLNEERRYEKEQLENKNNPTYEEEATPGQALSDIRDVNEVGSPKIKAYQYEHPEVKPYFREEARGMLSDLRNSQKGGRYIYESQERGQGTNYDVLANKRFTSPEIAELLDSKWGYTYDDIEKGLNAIIEDHGAENIAVAKRIELVLDDNLRNGYTDWQTGMEIPPNQEYLNMLAEQEWQNYFDDINSQYPLEQNVPQHAIDEETDFSDVKIEPDLSDFTEDDIDVTPFLEGLQGARERQAERQQLRNELNEKREVKVPKNVELNKAKNRGLGLLVNEFAEIDDYSKRTGNKNIKFKADTYNNYQAIAQSNIETAQTDINGKAIGRSGNSIFEEAKSLGLEDTFDEYLKQWANVDRAKQGKGVANYSAKESYKIVKEMEAKNPALKRLGNDMWQYYRNARHNLRDAGIINQDVSDMLGRMYPHYTPYISENIENYFTDKGELKPKATIKRAKGGAAIGSLLSAEEAMQRYTKSEFNTIFGNDLYREIVNTSNDIVQLGGDDRGMQFVNADNLYADKNGYYLTAYEDGNPITARISEDMYRTLSRESRNRISDIENTFSMVTKPLQAASNIRRNILTSWSPTFMAKNFIKDFQEGIFNSKYTKDFIKNYPSAFKELATNTELAQQFKSLYGSGLTMGQFDIDANNYNPSGKNRNFLKGIKNVNELIELAPRFAEFKASLDHGASIQEAMYNAREVTTNFSRGGTLAKALNRNGFTFLNSSIQGFDKFIRNFSGENGAKGVVNSLLKATMFGIAPAVFNELAFGSGDDKDKEYEALPDYIKDNYYIIKTGDGNFIRIPKGRVLSVFGSAARRTIEAMEGEENAFEGYWNNVQQQIGINNPEENNIFAPFIQAMGGRKLDSGQTAGSAWYGGDIIPSRLQKERPEDQYDASIDKLSIWLGQKTGISPYKINYVLDQYTGGIGDIGLPMITEEANSDGSIIAPIKDQFTADTITDNKYVSEFYDTKGKLYTGSKATDEDVLKNKYMNSISSEMAKLYAERREVQADTSLTKQQKYAKSQAIKAEINRLAKEGMDNYNDIIMSNNYAKIGDTEYYKNANGQWAKTTDDVASLGLDTEEKSEYYKVKNDIYTTKKNNDGNDKPLVIQDIVNSNLTPDAKVNLYTSNYKDDLVQPLVDSGMNVDSYLTFKSQSFTADKDSNGKSISGSKKRKVFDYINSMNVPYEQKLILAKSEYNSFNDNNYEIIEYIENTGMDYDERIQLYKALGFKVDGDSISW